MALGRLKHSFIKVSESILGTAPKSALGNLK